MGTAREWDERFPLCCIFSVNHLTLEPCDILYYLSLSNVQGVCVSVTYCQLHHNIINNLWYLVHSCALMQSACIILYTVLFYTSSYVSLFKRNSNRVYWSLLLSLFTREVPHVSNAKWLSMRTLNDSPEDYFWWDVLLEGVCFYIDNKTHQWTHHS